MKTSLIFTEKFKALLFISIILILNACNGKNSNSGTLTENFTDVPLSYGKIRLGMPLDSVAILYSSIIQNGDRKCYQFGNTPVDFFGYKFSDMQFCGDITESDSKRENQRLYSIFAIGHGWERHDYKILFDDLTKRFGEAHYKDSSYAEWDSHSAVLSIRFIGGYAGVKADLISTH